MTIGQHEGPNGPEYVIENDEAITELFLYASEIAAYKTDMGEPADCLIAMEKEMRKSIFRKKEKITDYVPGWNLHGCEPAGIASLALSTDGTIYLDSANPMYGGDEQIPVMPYAVELSDVHFANFARVEEINAQLEAVDAVSK